jgi:hypothetical protein
MIHGVHLLLYSRDAEADRAFFRDVLNLGSVDLGDGWLIFGLPPAEVGIHPGDGSFVQNHADENLTGCVVYLMCDNLRETIDSLSAKGVATTAIQEAEWGIATSVRLPSGGGLGLYEPRHATALHLVKQ